LCKELSALSSGRFHAALDSTACAPPVFCMHNASPDFLQELLSRSVASSRLSALGGDSGCAKRKSFGQMQKAEGAHPPEALRKRKAYKKAL